MSKETTVIPVQPPLYRPEFEHDNCGIGAVVNIKGIKTHATVEQALTIVETLEHRAGKDAEGKTGDGVGILIQISHRFFSKVTKELGFRIGGEREYGIGMFFFPQDELERNQAKKMLEIVVEKEGMEFLGWRTVPIVPEVLGNKAVACMPYIMQGFIKKPADIKRGIDFDRKLYIARRIFEQSNENTYVVSMSSRTIVYKGMFLVGQLRQFLQICRMRIMNLPLRQFIPVLARIQRRVGCGPIRTVLLSTTARLIRFREMRTECWPERKRCVPRL